MFSSQKLSVKIWLSIAILILGYCFSVSLSSYSSNQTQKGLVLLSEFAGTSSELSQKAIIAYARQLKLYEDAVLTGETDLIKEGHAESLQIETALKHLERLGGLSNTTREKISATQKFHENFTESGEKTYTKMSTGDIEDTLSAGVQQLSEQKAFLKTALTEISTLVRDDLLRNIGCVVTDSKRQNHLNLAVFLGVVSASVLLIFLLIRRSILAPLYRLLAGINDSSGQVTKISEEVASASRQLATGAIQQASSLEETAASLEEMAAMTKQNADNAGNANHLVQEAMEMVSAAQRSMEDLNLSMERISNASLETRNIIQSIEEIAFQTNLLALNAAVEAARAGEAGAGFAVVADEVRNLAQRSASAAKNTAEIINSTDQEIQCGAKLVEKGCAVFAQVVECTEKVKKLVEKISSASGEQARGLGQINVVISEIEKVTQQTVSNADKSASVSIEMRTQANQMNRLLDGLVKLVGLSLREQESNRSDKTWGAQNTSQIAASTWSENEQSAVNRKLLT